MGIALGTAATGRLVELVNLLDDGGDAFGEIRTLIESGHTSDRLEIFPRQPASVLPEKWYARRVSANNEKLWVSEAYTREEDAYRGGHRAAPDLAP